MTKRRPWLPLVGAVAAAFTAGGCGGSHPQAVANRILFFSDRTGAWSLYSMNLAGGDQQPVVNKTGNIEPGGDGIGYGAPTVSPDGRQVVLPAGGITVVTLATGKSRRIPAADGSSALWSPDSNDVVYADNHNFTQTGVFVTDVRNGKTRRVLRSNSASPVSWSPDGKWILFNRQFGAGSYSLWLLHPDGTGLRKLTTYVPDGPVLWQTAGRIEYVGSRGGNIEKTAPLVIVNVRSGTVAVLGRLPTPDAMAWSPDGRRFVYSAGTDQSAPSAVYTMDAWGRERRRLTPKGSGFYGQLPAWSPDGRTLVVARYGHDGIEERTAEIWTMHADGSHQQQLTRAYPDGGENVDPLWITSPVVRTTTPRPQTTALTLRVPYLLGGIAAQGEHAAVVPLGHDQSKTAQPTAPLLVWHPGTSPESLVGSPCGSFPDPVFHGSRLAVDCSHHFLDETAQSILVFDLKTRTPVQPMDAYSANFGSQYGTVLGGPVLVGGKVEFESSHWRGLGKRTNRSRLINQTLWVVEGGKRRPLYSSRGLGTLLASTPTRLAFQLANGGIAIANDRGKPQSVLRLPPAHLRPVSPPPVTYLLTSRDFLRLAGTTLQAWNIKTGRLDWSRRVPLFAQLQSAAGDLVVYIAGASIDILASAGTRVIQTNADVVGPWAAPVTAALTPAGLFYAYNVKDSRYPGRVVFVPRSDLPR